MSPLSSGQPKVSGTLRSSKRRLEKLHPSLIKTLRGPGAGWGGDGQERGLGAPSSSRRDSQPRGPSPEAEGLECGGGKGERGRGGGKISLWSFVFLIGSDVQRRAALLSWLGLDQVQAPGFRPAQCGAAEGAPVCPSAGQETGWEAAVRGQRWPSLLRHFRNLKQ